MDIMSGIFRWVSNLQLFRVQYVKTQQFVLTQFRLFLLRGVASMQPTTESKGETTYESEVISEISNADTPLRDGTVNQ